MCRNLRAIVADVRRSFAMLALLLGACGPAPPLSAEPVEPAAGIVREPETVSVSHPPRAETMRPPEVTIGAGGDVLVHRKVARSAAVHEAGYAHVFGELASIVSSDAIAFVNLETPLSMRVPPTGSGSPVLGAPAEVARALAAIGVDVVSVANNHAYDQTARGLEETLVALSEAGILPVGAAARERDAPGPRFISVGRVRIAFLAFTERINRGPQVGEHEAFVARFDPQRASQALEGARRNADLVVVSMHWSHDFYRAPLPRQRQLARWLVDRGADLILGHGPHVLQEVELLGSPRGEAVCAYSLGNFVSNQGLSYHPGRRASEAIHPALVLPESRDGAWLRVRFVLEEELRVLTLEAVPLWTHNNHFERMRDHRVPIDIRVRPLRAIEHPGLVDERRAAIARALGPAVQLLD